MKIITSAIVSLIMTGSAVAAEHMSAEEQRNAISCLGLALVAERNSAVPGQPCGKDLPQRVSVPGFPDAIALTKKTGMVGVALPDGTLSWYLEDDVGLLHSPK